MSEYIIEAENLARVYKTYQKQEGLIGSLQGFFNRKSVEKIALSPTSLKIEPGQIIGLVGANGAGKTTLLKLLSGLIHPSSGTAKVLGYTPWERKNAYLKQMSILLGQKNQLWWDITPRDSYSLLAEIYDLNPARAKDRVVELATMLDCKHVLDTQLRRLSLGERMKMEIIGSLLHEPKVMFLDEPTIGLDIVAQTAIRKFLIEYVKSHKPTVILTSHYMDDIAKLADRLLLISKGQIVYDGTVADFTKKSEVVQKIVFSLESPLLRDFIFADPSLKAQVLRTGEQSFVVEVPENKLALTLNQVTQLGGIVDLKIEQTDFEQVVHGFLEKEQSRI